MDHLEEIARLIEAIRPWHQHLVIVGGWAHRLYRFHGNAAAPGYQPVQTMDADIAFGSEKLTGNIGAALKTAGFQEVLLGDHTPPVSEYRLGGERGDFFAEFLAPHHGSGISKNGTPDATVQQAGVTAQRLRHLSLLVLAPWTVRLTPEDIPLKSDADILLPNPVSYIAQKLLITKTRGIRKTAQDVLYIHDTLELFGGKLDVLRSVWEHDVRPNIPLKTAQSIEREWQRQFGSLTDVIRSAARIPQDRVLATDQFQATCAYGLEVVFGKEDARQ